MGVVWPHPRFEQINSVVLTLNTFGDGGWFGPNGAHPEPGGVLGPEHLQNPIVQVSTNGGLTWFNVPFPSDYMTTLTGANFGGTQPTAIFAIEPAVTRIDGLRLIGPNAGNAGPDPNGFIGVADLVVESNFTDADTDGMPDG